VVAGLGTEGTTRRVLVGEGQNTTPRCSERGREDRYSAISELRCRRADVVKVWQ